MELSFDWEKNAPASARFIHVGDAAVKSSDHGPPPCASCTTGSVHIAWTPHAVLVHMNALAAQPTVCLVKLIACLSSILRNAFTERAGSFMSSMRASSCPIPGSVLYALASTNQGATRAHERAAPNTIVQNQDQPMV